VSNYQLAQLNIGNLVAPLDSPQLKDFVDNLDRINAVAESSPGFVWRLIGDGNDATSLRPLGDNVLVNMSVWRDAAALKDYVYRSAHAPIMKRRREWFTRPGDAHMVLWWVAAGHEPTVAEAVAKLMLLRQNGSTPDAFTFGEAYAAPDDGKAGEPFSFNDTCPA
jgi:Domain of unknown function (DUF3291)